MDTIASSDRQISSSRTPEGARIVEVFSSIQGEGTHVGRRHIFVRFFACNIRCRYCDTPESLTGDPPARLERTPGLGDFEVEENPISLDRLADAVGGLTASPHDAVSLTGGEPLLQADAISRLAPRIHELGLSCYLETNGTLPQNLSKVIDQMDVVAVDIKLPETLRGGKDWMEEHETFLRIAARQEVFCKMVLTPGAQSEGVNRAAGMVARISRSIPLVIQPVTPFGEVGTAPDSREIALAYETAKRHLEDVRVIPQTHKMIRLR